MAPAKHIKPRAKNHQCPAKDCDTSYTNLKDLHGHLRKAHRAKKLSCPYPSCSQLDFTHESNVKRHVKQCHEDNGKKWECPGENCKYSSDRKGNAERHAQKCPQNALRVAPMEAVASSVEQVLVDAAAQRVEPAEPVAVAQQLQFEVEAPASSSVPIDPTLLQMNTAEQSHNAAIQQQEAEQLPLGWSTTEHYQEWPLLDPKDQTLEALLLQELRDDDVAHL
ncbi:hypothetical protein H2198_000429 [Neophaeococcomyces mojaviensis]|uniref:Uncharacterized protein n=1 Tax=Neophaeococcomyces mojaviensis TaxID=3383035 RepID=A0ACC3AK12_9EURO|nr:hypothetical protein H2198_000429 [Knufia sp. JES_112]